MIYIAVCDDDKNDLNIAVDILSGIFRKYRINYNLELFLSSIELLEQINKVDIAILDISMECLNGIELGRRLKVKFPEIQIIYTTSYEEYCMQAINGIHAFSFLCKPLQKEEMENQISDLLHGINHADNVERIFYKLSDSVGQEFPALKIKIKDVLYFENVKSRRKIAMILADIEYEFSYVMKNLISELDAYGFAVNCRGILVNLRHIVKIKGYNIYLDNGKVLALSQKRAVGFKERMNQFIHNNI